MDTETAERRSDVADATKRKDLLQKQISDLGKYNDDTRAENQERGQDDLSSSSYLNIFGNFKQEHAQSDFQKPSFETNPAGIDFSQP